MYVHAMTKSELAAFIKITVAEAIMGVKNELKSLSPDAANDYITVAETVKIFKVTKPTIYNWIKQGLIKKNKIQGRTLLRKSELQSKFY